MCIMYQYNFAYKNVHTLTAHTYLNPYIYTQVNQEVYVFFSTYKLYPFMVANGCNSFSFSYLSPCKAQEALKVDRY